MNTNSTMEFSPAAWLTDQFMIYPPLGAHVPNLTFKMMGECTGQAADLGVTGWGRTAQ